MISRGAESFDRLELTLPLPSSTGSIQLSDDGSRLLIVADEPTIAAVYDAATGRRLRQLPILSVELLIEKTAERLSEQEAEDLVRPKRRANR